MARLPRDLHDFKTVKRHLLMRWRGERRGFRLVPFHGEPAIIAHVEFPKAHQVGKDGVDVAAIDAALDTALARRRGTTVYLVDEIGKMECLLSGRVPLVATVAQRGAGFIAEVKRRENCELWTLTRANRDAMPFEIINRLH